jgi:hypothetical protein
VSVEKKMDKRELSRKGHKKKNKEKKEACFSPSQPILCAFTL